MRRLHDWLPMVCAPLAAALVIFLLVAGSHAFAADEDPGCVFTLTLTADGPDGVKILGQRTWVGDCDNRIEVEVTEVVPEPPAPKAPLVGA